MQTYGNCIDLLNWKYYDSKEHTDERDMAGTFRKQKDV